MPITYKSRSQHQEELVEFALNNSENKQDTLIVAPTGFGKTRVFNKIAAKFTEENQKTLIIQDRIKISKQNGAEARRQGIKNVSICYEGKFDQNADLVFAVSNTIHDNLKDIQKYHNVIIDECHHTADDKDSKHSAILNRLIELNPNLNILAFTAHDERSDGLELHERIRNANRKQITQREAEKCGAIVPTITSAPQFMMKNFQTIEDIVDNFIDPNNPTEKLPGLQKYLQDNLSEDYNQKCVEIWERNTPKSAASTFVIADSVEDCAKLKKEFEKIGVKAEEIHYQVDEKEIENRFRRYKAGKTTALISVKMLSEGVDEPITANLLNTKKTTTLQEWIQMNGRPRRAYEGRTQCQVIDCGSSFYIHGSIEKMAEVEAYVHLGKEATKWRPWNLVSGKTETSEHSAEYPQVYAINDGRTTLFAVKEKALDREFKVFIKDEIRVGSKKNQNGNTTRIARYPLGPQTRAQIEQIGLDSVRANKAIYTVLATRVKSKSVKNVLKQSYEESKTAIEMMLKPQQKAKQKGGMEL